jgi:hypothetical protein
MKTALLTLFATVLIAGCSTPTRPSVQNHVQSCPTRSLYGRWRVHIDGQPDAIAHLGPHPDYAGVRGTLAHAGATAQLAGDIDDDGDLALDQSEDGHAISASWTLQWPPAACGQELTGTWQHAGGTVQQPLVMTRMPPAP